MSAESTGIAAGTGPERRARPLSRRMGVLAFLLAVFFAALPWLVTLAFAVTGTGGSSYVGVAMLAYLVHVLGLLAALTLGILAVVNGRGRGWGIAAIVISIVFSQTVLTALMAIFGGMAPQV
jgi:hypothetical protein